MIQAGDSLSHQFPILSELMNFRSHMDGIRFGSWTFREVLDRLLAISAAPVKQTLKVTHMYDLSLVFFRIKTKLSILYCEEKYQMSMQM